MRTVVGRLTRIGAAAVVLGGVTVAGSLVAASPAVAGGGLPSDVQVTTCASSGTGSLPAAVTTADGSSGDTIDMTGLTTSSTGCSSPLTITLASSLSITSDMTIEGPGASSLTVSGNSAMAFYVGGAATATISGLTVSSGGCGGNNAAIVNAGYLAIEKASISDNPCDGVDNTGTLIVTDTTISHNAGFGIANSSSASLTNATISYNATGILSADFADLHLDSSTISYNGTGLSTFEAFTYTSDDVVGSIFSHNTTRNCWEFGNYGTFTFTSAYNVADDPTCFGSNNGNVIASRAAIGLGTLAANGSTGPETEAITTSSAAYAIVPKGDCPLTDERGDPRPASGNCDAGAYQTQGSSPPPPSALLIITTSGTYGTPLVLETIGAIGGLPNYFVEDPGSAGCSLSNLMDLSASSPGTCVVVAWFDGATSSPTTITFAPADQAPLAIASTSGTYGSPLVLSSTGGSDNGAVSYTVDAPGTAGCSLSGASLSATSAGSCTVTATMAGNADYAPVSSSPTAVSFAPADQAPLTITSTSGSYGSPLALSTTGGSDSGAVSYTVDDPGTAGCSLSGASLSATSAGSCAVTATMAGNADYAPVSSSPTTVTISPAPTKTVLRLSRAAVSFGHEQAERLFVTVSSAGGAPTGQVTITGTSCRITLVDGQGGCTLAKSELAVSKHPYVLTASYLGGANFGSSHSAGKQLRVKGAKPHSTRSSAATRPGASRVFHWELSTGSRW